MAVKGKMVDVVLSSTVSFLHSLHTLLKQNELYNVIQHKCLHKLSFPPLLLAFTHDGVLIFLNLGISVSERQ